MSSLGLNLSPRMEHSLHLRIAPKMIQSMEILQLTVAALEEKILQEMSENPTLEVKDGTLYPVLLKLENEGAIASEWGTSEKNRRARFYKLTAAGRRRVRAATEEWAATTALMDRFIGAKAEDLA